MREMLGSLMYSRNSPKTTQDDETGRANILGVPIQKSRANTIKIKEKCMYFLQKCKKIHHYQHTLVRL